jgi:hypothetical protein
MKVALERASIACRGVFTGYLLLSVPYLFTRYFKIQPEFFYAIQLPVGNDALHSIILLR